MISNLPFQLAIDHSVPDFSPNDPSETIKQGVYTLNDLQSTRKCNIWNLECILQNKQINVF